MRCSKQYPYSITLSALISSLSGTWIASAFAVPRLMISSNLVGAQEPSYNRWRGHIIALASGYGIPTMYALRDYPAAGGLVSYDASTIDQMRQVGVYVGRILKGDKPADLPVVQPTKFELVIKQSA